MTHYICQTCGVQFSQTAAPPEACPICEDERQYVHPDGQQWTTLEALQAEHHNIIKPIEPNLIGISTSPKFAIGQRALLVQTPEGNLLWDSISLIDEPTIAVVQSLGGLRGIAISHPHFYSSMVEWARAFEVPIYLPAANRPWVMRPDSAIEFWDGESKKLWGGLRVVRTGGHFTGSSLLHWSSGAEGRGAIMTGDTLYVTADRRYVSFMRSYPNLIPLSAVKVKQIVSAIEPYAFDRIYGGWWQTVVEKEGQAAVAKSAARYIEALQAE